MKKFKYDGITYDIQEKMLTDDMETLRMLAEAQEDETKAYYFPLIIKRVLGDEGYKKACKRYQTEKGNIPPEPFSNLFAALVEQFQQAKN